jgi:O-Antigen ligase
VAKPIAPASNRNWESLFTGLLGLAMALALIKLGTPVILDDKVEPPASLDEVLLQPWPFVWGCVPLALAVSLGFWRFFRWPVAVSKWVVVLPALWLCWQMIAATRTISPELSVLTVRHFAVCIVLFYLGLCVLTHVNEPKLFWIAIAGGFFVVMLVAWEQHFGGLERTREYVYSRPNWRTFPPDLLKKVASNRVYGTQFYPNALAGIIILLLPATLFWLWRWTALLSKGIQILATAGGAVVALGSLFWSGSKAGWLIVLGQGAVALVHGPVSRRVKLTFLVALLALGTGAFGVKYREYFAKGATSAAARLDYWRAAWQTLEEHPVAGTGPGTFMISYAKIKPPESEMARLTHNDFLQQGSDSGWVGMLLFAAFVGGSLGLAYRKRQSQRLPLAGWAVWLGLVGFAAQSLVEFGLYIPASAWLYFLLLGWICGRDLDGKAIDKTMHPL